MSEGLNKVQCIGNLCADPELKFTQGGQALLRIRIACNERYKDKDDQWKDRAEYVTCTMWGKRAEALNKILAKGTQVYVEGRLQTRSWETDGGEKRYATDVNVNNLLLLSGKKDGGVREQRSESYGGGQDDFGDLPF